MMTGSPEEFQRAVTTRSLHAAAAVVAAAIAVIAAAKSQLLAGWIQVAMFAILPWPPRLALTCREQSSGAAIRNPISSIAMPGGGLSNSVLNAS